MLKRLFFFLLKRYSTTESERVAILKVINQSVCEEYYEQTVYGNIYNYFWEFMWSLELTIVIIGSNNPENIKTIKRGMSQNFDGFIRYVNNVASGKIKRRY